MRPPFIETFTGVQFQPLSPRREDVRVADIAHALSNQCRFSGHVRRFYSVAEHSVRVSKALEAWGCSPDTQFWGLLHDASEAYLVDLPTPLKDTPEIGTGYRAAEGVVMRVIVDAFGLAPTDEPRIVRHADAVMLATEVRDLMFGRAEHWTGLTALPLETVAILPWAPKDAERHFLDRYFELEAYRHFFARKDGA